MVFAIVGLTVINSTFVILSDICENVGLPFFKCPTIANTCSLAVIGPGQFGHLTGDTLLTNISHVDK